MALIWRGKKVSARIRTRAWQNVKDATLIVEAAVKTSMKLGGTTPTGETIEGEKPGKVGMFASKPGEVPRVQFGRLKGSITTEMAPSGLPIGRVGTNIEYGKFLELGTRNMAPRPFMRPALHKSEAAIKARFSEPMVGD